MIINNIKYLFLSFIINYLKTLKENLIELDYFEVKFISYRKKSAMVEGQGECVRGDGGYAVIITRTVRLSRRQQQSHKSGGISLTVAHFCFYL